MKHNNHYIEAVKLYEAVAERHARGDEDTLAQETQVLDWLHAAAAEGCKAALVADAVLAATNNWATLRFTRNGLFVGKLEEAIDAGALASDDDEAWQWLAKVYYANPDEPLMYDYERLYDFLMTAAEDGCTTALDICLDIWPPEQEIEED